MNKTAVSGDLSPSCVSATTVPWGLRHSTLPFFHLYFFIGKTKVAPTKVSSPSMISPLFMFFFFFQNVFADNSTSHSLSWEIPISKIKIGFFCRKGGLLRYHSCIYIFSFECFLFLIYPINKYLPIICYVPRNILGTESGWGGASGSPGVGCAAQDWAAWGLESLHLSLHNHTTRPGKYVKHEQRMLKTGEQVRITVLQTKPPV